ncbi:cellulase family glycosylhydrolase [Streptomyces sp. SAJ15]|uniref:cellulase family glycosylhydrolase n=1 Tax=Streptomyces sp. SAJ15 TaxID=2011095 RepID=UPI0011863BC5|nr:cellulase family glycosylhydrolase [Streptomyces sp. SAJ15]TVL91383.1 endoglycoceramidase [Streptomyces sp. SAJ15]
MRLHRAATTLTLAAALLLGAAGTTPAAPPGAVRPAGTGPGAYGPAGNGPAADGSRAAGVEAPPAAARPEATTPVGTVITPDGRAHLADRHGRALRPRGLNLGKTDTVTEDRVAKLAADGFDLMRLNIQWERVEPRRGHYDTGYLRYLDRILGWADRHRVLVLVDWHQDVYGPAFGHNGMPAWATRTDGLPFEPNPDDWFSDYFQPAVQAAFTHLYDDADLRAAQAAVYAKVAATLRGHPSLLGYDLFNEPFGPIAGDPSDPADQLAAAIRLETGRLPAMYRRLIAAIRSVDRDAWLFLEPTVLVGQGVPTSLPGFTDPRPGADRLGYAPHYYDTAVESGADWDPTGGFIEAYEAAIGRYPVAHRLPVLVGEWGPPRATTPGNAELVRRQVASLRGFASGWAMWYSCAAPGGAGYCVYDGDGTPAPGKEPAFAPYATAVAGAPRSETYDATDGGYALTLTADRTSRRAWTWLELPAAVCPDGARVSVTGAGRAVVREEPGGVAVLLPAVRPGATVTITARPAVG